MLSGRPLPLPRLGPVGLGVLRRREVRLTGPPVSLREGPPCAGVVTHPAGDGPLELVGGFFRMCALTARALFLPPFQWRETLQQGWFITSVAIIPTIAVAIPLTVLLDTHGGDLYQSGPAAYLASLT